MRTPHETEKLRLEARQASERRDTIKALTAADELLRRDPNDVDGMFILGTALMTNGHEGTAALVLNAARCATKDPEKLGPIWNNLGYALHEYQPAEAYRAFTESLKYGEAPAFTYDNLCSVCTKLGRHAEALEWSDKAHGFDVSYNRSFALLHLGRWEEGWAAYAKSAGTPQRPRTDRSYGLPRWDGKRPGRVIVHGEQGVGDEIMFLSMLPKDFDGVIETTERTADLFARSFPNATVHGTLLKSFIEWPIHDPADWHLEMGGLGEHFGRQPFRRQAFLKADRPRQEAWQAWLNGAQRALHETGATGGLGGVDTDNRPDRRSIAHVRRTNSTRVGIAWTGGTWSTQRDQRSIPFHLIEDLIRAHPEVTFVNLEYEDRREELSDLPQVLNPHWATKKGADLDDLAALLSSLDLVITATNSTVDLAGALGVPCWALVDAFPQWRYSTASGENEMWFYESVRTFRQKPADEGKWARVIGRVSKALHEMTAAKVAAE